MKRILWLSGKAFLKLGIPFDFHLNNFTFDEKSQKFVLFDSGNPIVEKKLAVKENYAIQSRIKGIFRAYNRFRFFFRIKNILNIDADEIRQMNKEFDFDIQDVNDLFQDYIKIAKSLGVTKDDMEYAFQLINIEYLLNDITAIDGNELLEKISAMEDINWDPMIKAEIKTNKKMNRETWMTLLISKNDHRDIIKTLLKEW